jgi:SAM-dependent methyltransferase
MSAEARSTVASAPPPARERQHPYELPYHWGMSRFHRYVVEQAVGRVADALSGAYVLDVGCGDGFTTALVARHARGVHGIDLNPRAIAFAKLIVDDPHVSFAVGAAGEVEEAAASASETPDAIAAFEVVEHLDSAELDGFLDAARAILAPSDGALVVSTPNAARMPRGNPFHVEEMTAPELAARLRSRGFEVEMLEGLYVRPPQRLEHFANTVPFRAAFRALARSGRNVPRLSRTLVCVARPATEGASL